ncbi:hypothetical protein AAHE18_03G209400 [Arachis hypogaea]
MLRRGKKFEWTSECELAFQDFKRFLGQQHVLTRPQEGEALILYLAIGSRTVALALVREDESGQQPIYFISKALQGSELNYQKIEKFSYTLILTSRRLRSYFQAHTMKWAIELSKFDLQYEARTVIKSQYLADFIAVYTDTSEIPTKWNLYMDGSSNKTESGSGAIIESNQGTQIELSLKFEFPASNNQAEYEALLAGLKLAKEVRAHKLVIFSDSQVVTSQIAGTYQAKDPAMKKYLDKTREQLRQFQEYEIQHIPREQNARADALSKLSSTKPGGNNRSLIQEVLQNPSISEEENILAISEELISVTSTWPFAKWGLDLLGPFPQGSRQVKFLIVGIDYFTKWIETEPLANAMAQRSQKFLYRNIITRFGVPYSITTDNGTQFIDTCFRKLVADLKIKHQFTFVEHLQANGQAEAANKVILVGLKRRLQDAKGAWAEELPQVLWTYRTTPHPTTKKSPFRLAYGMEVMIPVKVEEGSLMSG